MVFLFFAAPGSGMLHSIRDIDAAILEALAVKQFQVDLPFHPVEKRNPRREQDGMNAETYFIDKVRVEERPRKFTASHDTDPFAGTFLQFAHEADGITRDNLERA